MTRLHDYGDGAKLLNGPDTKHRLQTTQKSRYRPPSALKKSKSAPLSAWLTFRT